MDRCDFTITAEHLDYEMLRALRDHPDRAVCLSDSAVDSIKTCRSYLDARLEREKAPIYGINTGFGALRDHQISKENLKQLQVNLIRSHACGSGAEVPEAIVRLMLLLKVKSLSFGHSGAQLKTAERLLAFYNAGIHPVVYNQGSLGASGDLAPLAHLCLPLIGEGEVNYQGKRYSGKEMLALQGWEPIELQSKEGLALLNGTQFMLAYAVHIYLRAQKYSRMADRIAALSLDAFDGRIDPFNELLHKIRPHAGQVRTAEVVREFLEGSELISGPGKDVQDPYSFRCVPQVHGASKDAINWCAQTFLTEVNSTTDNPNIFVEADEILSGGNFHGQPLALALDFMAMALAELGSISERRVFQLLSGARKLPPFLVADPGLHSGLMIAQYTAASIVSRNKQLCTPASVDTIPSSNGQEDHVSMGANAAVQCLEVIDNLRTLLGIELLTASQALWFREPRKTGVALLPFLEAFRAVVPPVTTDRILAKDIDRSARFIDDWGL